MVLENDALYYAIQKVSENGYVVTANWFFWVIIVSILFIGMIFGIYIGYRMKGLFKDEKKNKNMS